MSKKAIFIMEHIIMLHGMVQQKPYPQKNIKILNQKSSIIISLFLYLCTILIYYQVLVNQLTKYIVPMIMNTRRDFLKKAAMGSAMLSIPSIVASAMNLPSSSKIVLQKNDVILFQGDSITDAGRNKETKTPNTSPMMGSGYVMLAAGKLLYQYAEKELTIYNKGISGNKVYQLADRWNTDCIDLKPNVLSILVGVNDFWHTKSSNYKGTSKKYEDDYRALIQRTLTALPNVKLIVGEPFAVTGIKAVDDTWFPAFDEYRAIAQRLALEFDAIFIPYHTIFNEAQKRAPGVYWTHDGVHASLAGAQLMAHAWMQAVE